MQLVGGACDSVPTGRVPGAISPSAPVFTADSGSTVGVVYLSSCGRRALASLRGNAIALSAPVGAHWLVSAATGGAIPGPATIISAAVSTSTRPARRPRLTLMTATYRLVGRSATTGGCGHSATACADPEPTQPGGANTPRRTSSASMTLPITSARPMHAARAAA